MQYKKVNFLGDFLNGQFVLSIKPDGQFKDESPGDLSDQIMTAQYNLDHIEKACEYAKKAYLPWARLSLDERKQYILRLKDIFISHEAEMAEAIARDTGKALWDATTEAKALSAKIDITLNESLKLVAESRFANALPNVDGVLRYKSRGVMAVVGPFNFPAHLPNGHIIPALVTGNTVIFKPSEQTPFVGQMYAQMIEKAEFPPGVFNLV
ncbi:MAG: aldehyde dehydrogenase family protein, partial [Bdellovibrionaceae bacterium]|nr:aldehyde dehydrogenase family protein [Pseudobdellovibrionaceae bacterium]